MSNKKTQLSIAELITDLEKENEDLKYLQKLFESACKHYFGMDIQNIKIILDRHRLIEQRRAESQGQQATISPSEM